MSNFTNFILALLLFVSQKLFSIAIQTHIPNGIWVPIGINSVYENLSLKEPWKSHPALIISDIADNKFTYIASNANSYGYAFPNGIVSTSINLFNNTTVFNDATLAIFAIKNSKTLLNQTLNGSATNAVHIKILNPKEKRNIPHYTMYLEGLSTPTVRIEYQANYEGDRFKIKFGANNLDNTQTFYAYFNSKNTYNNPAKLYIDTIDASIKKSVLIKDAIDFNITDNNITAMINNVFSIKDDLKLYSTGDEVIIYKFENGGWKIFNSSNKGNSNAFDKFEVGGAYWINASSQNAHNDNNFTKMGLISNSIGSITQEVYENATNGWNMMTFSDDYRYVTKGAPGPKYSLTLRYSPTGMFIPSEVLEVEGVNLFFNKLSSSTTNVVDKNITLNISTAVNSRYQNNTDIAQGINLAVFARNKFFDEGIKMRAFPAMNRDMKDGVIIISNSTFEVNSSNASITTLSNNRLGRTATGGFFAPYGDYLLAFDSTMLGGHDINSSMQVNFHLLSGTPTDITDLNVSDNSNKLNAIYDGLQKASRDSKGNKQRINADSFLIQLDFNTSENYDTANKFSGILLGANEKMNIKDITYTKTFKYNTIILSDNFEIIGKKNKKVILPANTDIQTLVGIINSHYDDTGVLASELNTLSNSYFVITSNKVNSLGSLDLREGSFNLFDHFISISSNTLPEQNQTQGSIGKIYTHVNLFESSLTIDKDALYGINTGIADYSNIYLLDVNGTSKDGGISSSLFHTNVFSHAKVYAPGFPQGNLYNFPTLFTHAGKRATSMIGQSISSSGVPYWEVIDLTKSPKDWLGHRDYSKDSGNDFDVQTLLHLKENKAYWVRTIDTSRSRALSAYSITDNSIKIDKSFINYFNNDINSKGELQIDNHIFHKVSFSFKDTDLNQYVRDEYGVNAQFEHGQDYTFSALNDNFELEISNAYMQLYDGIHNINLRSLNEMGESFLGDKDKITIDFKKPILQSLSWLNGQLIIDDILSNYKVEVYLNHISEISSIRQRSLLKYPMLEDNDDLKWINGDDESKYALVKKIVIVLKKDGLYSNAKVSLYAPLKFGHVLQLDTDTGHSVRIPYSFKDSSYVEGVGIQLNRIGRARINKETIKLLYHPRNISRYTENTSIPNILYIKSKHSGEPTASISYADEHINNIFYFEHGDKIYQGRFPVNSNSIYTIDNDKVINIYNVNTVQSSYTGLLRLDYSPTVLNSQRIYIKGISN